MSEDKCCHPGGTPMKIDVSPEAMRNLDYGDVVEFRLGSCLLLTPDNFNNKGTVCQPWQIYLYGNSFSYSVFGTISADGKSPHPLDIIAIHKAEPEIPEGFIRFRWKGGECPVGAQDEVEVVIETGERWKAKATSVVWSKTKFVKDIIAYRVLPQKQRGEIWYVVSKYLSIETTYWPSKEEAVRSAKFLPPTYKVLAIFNPFKTNGKWEEGMGLELMKGKE